MKKESKTTDEKELELTKRKDRWYESTDTLLFIIAVFSFFMIWVIFGLMIGLPDTFSNPLSTLLITIFSLTCSAIFSFLASTLSHEKELKRYASSAMRHLSVVFSDTDKICERIQTKINQLEKSDEELDKRTTIGMLENIAVMNSSLKSHIQHGETNWQGIFEDELEPYLLALTKKYQEIYQGWEQDKQERQEQIRSLENQKEADQKTKEATRKEIDRLKQEVRDIRSKQQSALSDMFPITTTFSTLTPHPSINTEVFQTCEFCGNFVMKYLGGGKCIKCGRYACNDCVVSATNVLGVICKECARSNQLPP